jgi:hypothetical protein
MAVGILLQAFVMLVLVMGERVFPATPQNLHASRS